MGDYRENEATQQKKKVRVFVRENEEEALRGIIFFWEKVMRSKEKSYVFLER